MAFPPYARIVTKWKAALALAALIGGTELWALRPRRNPPVAVERSFESHLRVTPAVHALLRRTCMDCHSNETRWPWYSRLAPVSWLISRDVERGRRVLNLSEWSVQAGRKPELGASILAAACAAARSGRMPRFPYGLVHPEARLSPADLDTLCGWTSSEVRRLIQQKRKAAIAPPKNGLLLAGNY